MVFFATPSADPNMDCFLKHVAPKEMKDFFLWGNKYYRDEEDAPTEIDGYIEGLKPVYAATKNRVGFHNCSFSSSAFEETVKASCNVPTLVFFYCNLNLDSEISFNGPKYAINTISFQGSGNVCRNLYFNKIRCDKWQFIFTIIFKILFFFLLNILIRNIIKLIN